MKNPHHLTCNNRCIIFDMDGVLVNSEPLHFDFEKALFKSLGLDISGREHETFVGTNSRTMWKHIKKNHNLTLTAQELVKKEQSEFLSYLKTGKSPEPIPGVVTLLDKLSNNGYIIALASSSQRIVIDYFLEKCSLEKYFQIKLSGDDVVTGKPDPAIFLKAAEIAGIKPESCLVIEDSENGVTAAVAAGMKCIGYKNPDSGNQNLSAANLIINSFTGLRTELIDKIFIKQSG